MSHSFFAAAFACAACLLVRKPKIGSIPPHYPAGEIMKGTNMQGTNKHGAQSLYTY